MNAPLRPEDRRPARLNALPKLPIFLDLAGRSILVVGGSDGIAWKVELLAAAGGTVRILAENPSPELRAIVRNDPERVTLVQRSWREADLIGASVA
jgi:uroporphyrin-III C-methyltransferase/precorrin-2 dehydrogenase/sirohydrochlorin ferrochelatase